MSAFPLFRAERLTKRFGGFVALDSVDFDVGAGERVGLIGPNGSGKSTLVGCASGALHNDAGAVWFKDRRIDRLLPHQRVRAGLARTFQLPRPFRGLDGRVCACRSFSQGGRRGDDASMVRLICRSQLAVMRCPRPDPGRLPQLDPARL